MSLIYLNNKFLDEKQAVVPVSDRGLRFGDGVFETISVYNHKIYQEDRHKKRLREGLTALKISGVDVDDVFKQANILIAKNNLKNGGARITITRGSGSRGYMPTATNPTIFIQTMELKENFTKPVTLWLSSYQKTNAKSIPVTIKTLQGLNSTLARLEADENGCNEALLLNHEEHVCECSSSNIFWFKNNVLYTPSLECGIVDGTMRAAVIELSPYEVNQGNFDLSALKSADEVFITNVTRTVCPVMALNPLGISWHNPVKTTEIKNIIKDDIANSCN